MQDFLTFSSTLLSNVCSFLLSEPVIWFVGVFLLSAVASIFKRIISVS